MTTPDPRWTPETAYLNIHGTGRPGSVATTLAVSPTVNVDLLADGRIAGIEIIGAPADAAALLAVLHHVSVVTPELAALREAARAYAARYHWIFDANLVNDLPPEERDRLIAAVDAEARTTGAGT